MTLGRHKIDGIDGFPRPVIPAQEFESLLINAGYTISGSAPAQGRRLKVWWRHTNYRYVEAIYSEKKDVVITAYHSN